MTSYWAWVDEGGMVDEEGDWDGDWGSEMETWESRGIDVLIDSPDLAVGVEQYRETGPYLFMWHEA